jgi:hypothetical protein
VLQNAVCVTRSLFLVEACRERKLLKTVSLHSAFCISDVYKNQDAWVAEAAIRIETNLILLRFYHLLVYRAKVLRVLSEPLEYLNYPRDHPHNLEESGTVN